MSAATSITVRVPLKIRRRPGRKTVVMPVRDGGEAAIQTRADPTLLKALARAFRYQRLLDEGQYGSISEMSTAEGIDRGYLGRLLRLALLAPDVIDPVLEGLQPHGTDLPLLTASATMPWTEALQWLRQSAAASPKQTDRDSGEA